MVDEAIRIEMEAESQKRLAAAKEKFQYDFKESQRKAEKLRNIARLQDTLDELVKKKQRNRIRMVAESKERLAAAKEKFENDFKESLRKAEEQRKIAHRQELDKLAEQYSIEISELRKEQWDKDFLTRLRFSELYESKKRENVFRIADKKYHLPWKELSQDIQEAFDIYENGLSILYGQTQEDKKMYPEANWDAISRLLKSSSEKHKYTSAAKEIGHIGIAYKNNMEKFLMKMDELMKYVRNMNAKLIKSLREFLFVSRGTAGIILGSSIANFAVMFGSLMHKIFGFPWSSKILLIPTVTGAITFTTSLLSFTYMSQTTNDFAKDLNKQVRLLRDVIETHRRGDWIDVEVSNLFPYGINVNITDFKKVNSLKMTPQLKIYLCSKIIYNNVKRNKTLLRNEEFLIKVKLFVKSPAAEIWWSRMKIKILLEEISQKVNESSAKQFLSGHENLIYRTALYVYPVVIPWLLISRAPKETKFIFATLAGLFSALEFGEDGSDELDDLEKMYENYENEFREIYKICSILEDEDY